MKKGLRFFISTLVLLAIVSISNLSAQTVTDTYNTPGTFTWVCPAGVTTVDVECWGGGGAGGARTGAATGRAAAGGGGGYSRKLTYPVVAGNSYTVVVGAGGVTSVGPLNGGVSSFDATGIVANGGTGIVDNVAAPGGPGATAGTGDPGFIFIGGNGRNSVAGGTGGGGGGGSSAGTAANGVNATTRLGAIAPAGGGNGGDGGGGVAPLANYPGTNGFFPGGGGGGGRKDLVGGTALGGNGAGGQVLVTYLATFNPPLYTFCPSNMNVGTTGVCGAVVNYTPTLSGTPVITQSYVFSGATTGSGAGTGSGSTFNLGTTTVTITATNGIAPDATCIFTITVTDNEVPSITCPANITVGNGAGTCTAVVTYTAPTGTDNCPGATTTQIAGLASGATFPLGVTTNTFRVTDAAGNSTTCSFNVTVNDTEAPSITCGANQNVAAPLGFCTATVVVPGPTTGDNCGSVTVINSFNGTNDASGTYPVGVTNVTWTATDAAGNTSTCVQVISVTEITPPTITCGAPALQVAGAGVCNAFVAVAGPTANDNCGVLSVLNSFNGTGNASGVYPVGTTTVTWTVTDNSGNTATCTQSVQVLDNEPPSITCVNITVNTDPGQCDAVVTIPVPANSDNCGVFSLVNDFNSTGNASDTYPIGTTPVLWTIEDVNGNQNTCTMNVTVVDNQAPSITCPANISVGNTPATCGAIVTYTAPTGTDNCPGAITTQTAGLASGATFPVGVTTNTFLVTDLVGNTTTCSFTVTVTDTEAPAITCPSNISVNNTGGTCSATVTYTAPVGTDNCPSPVTTQTTGLASGATYPVGVTTNTFVVTDASGNSTTCSFTVTVTDTEAPTISCASAQTQSNDAGNCDANVTVTAPTFGDNCAGATIVNDYNSTSNASDTYPVGLTVVTWTVTDAAGNTNTCTQNITVTDDEDPAISCPSNISVSNTGGTCGAVVSYSTPSGTDNCPGETTTQTTGLASGSTFPVGVTTNTFVVTDAAGNSTTCSFTVTVNDTQAPSITCPANINVSNGAGICGAVVTYTAPVGTDNCPGASTTQTTGLASGATFPIGVTTNTFVVTDAAGNSTTCSFTVTVNDTEAPAISCPANISVSNGAGICGAVVTYTAPVGTDNCAGASTTQTSGLASGSTFPIGVTTNTFVVTDASGNSTTCSFTVTVTDTQAPTISCAANQTQTADAGNCDANVTVTSPTFGDNCAGATVVNDYNSTSNASDTYPVGVTPVTWTVTDASGNTTTCIQNITVTDNEAPSITCPSNISVSNTGGTCGAAVTFTAPTGTDNCPGASTTQTTGFASGATFPVGVTTNTFVVTDAAGNSTTCSFTVTVNDTEAPSITCPSNITTGNNVGSCSATVTYTAPVGTDNCAGATTTQIAGLASGATFPVGVTTNTFRVTDAAGNSTTCSFTVTVNDTEAPTITCAANQTQSNDLGFCEGGVLVVTPTFGDNCPGVGLVNDYNSTNNASDQYPVGVTIVTWTAFDVAGNTSTCTQTITVTDNEAPSLTCPSNITVNNGAGLCGAVVSYTTPVGTDNCPGETTTQIAGLASGSTFPVGVTTNTFRVTDASGNSTTCSFTVTVNDTQAPSITCPSNINVSNGAGLCGAVVTYTAPVGTDNCPGASTLQTTGFASGATFPVGVTTNTFVVTDASGNSTTCSFTVTVNDTEAPAISCPANISVSNGAGLCGAVVTYTAPLGTDNCPGSFTTQIAGLASGATFPVGVTTNTFRVTDAVGNSTTCSFTVTVTDTEAPTISCASAQTQSNDPGNCDANVTVVSPTFGDNCLGTTIVNDYNSTNNASDTYPVGLTVVTWTATDAAGNTSTCTQNITVNDTQAPSITCPSNITVSNGLGICGAVVTYTAPTGTDNCPGEITAQIAGLASGSTFPVGVTTNTFRVTDAAGNSTTCSFTVTVNDTQAPSISCPSNITVGNGIGTCGAIVTYTAPVGTDNCPSPFTTQTAGLASGSTFPLGVTTNTFVVTDAAGNSTTCSFTVTVNDTEAPSITCAANQTQSNDLGNCDANVIVVAPSFGDNCPGVVTIVNDYNSTSDASDLYPVGVTPVTWTVTDAAGNTTTCIQNITVTDNEAPSIACPSNISVSNGAGICGAVVSYTTPTGTDNCPGATTAQIAGLASGSTFPVGVTTNTFRVTDAAGNSTTCSFTVTVNDTEAPSITCPSSINVSNGAGICGAVVSCTAPTGTDNCPGATTTQTTGLVSGSTFPVGVTTNTFVVTDAAGNSTTCSFTVTVNDTEAPAITCPANISVSNGAGICGAVVNYTAPVGTDNCPGATTSQTTGLASGATFPIGVTTNTFVVTDAVGNSTTCGFTVTVTDTQAPTISCALDQTQSNDLGNCDANVIVTGPTFGDNCPGSTIVNDYNSTSDASDLYPVGVTPVTWTVTDAAGNTSTCIQNITVTDNEAPSIACPSNINVSNGAGICGAVVSYSTPTGTDNCPGASTTQIGGLASGSTFPVGVTTNTFRVTDAAGNSTTCSFTVTVNDTEAPAIACPSNITVNNGAGICGAIVTFTAPTGTDNCPGASTVQTTGLASGATFPVGVTTNTFVVTDAVGNSTTCSFTVTVNDTQAPTITCGADVTLDADNGVCDYTNDGVAGPVLLLTQYNPTGPQNQNPIAPNYLDPLVTASNLSISPNLGFINNNYKPVGPITNSPTLDLGKYVEFSVNSVGAIDYDRVQYTSMSYIGNSSRFAAIRSSLDGFTTDADVIPVNPAIVFPTTQELLFDLSSIPVTTGSITYRIYFYDAIVANDWNDIVSTNAGGNGVRVFGSSSVMAIDEATASDNCTVASVVNDYNSTSTIAGETFPVGTTPVIWTATDVNGNTSTCTQLITINDTQAPTITCPTDITVSNDLGSCDAFVTVPLAITNDNCGVASVVNDWNSTNDATDFYPEGTSIITWTVTDIHGNTTTCVQSITVNDTEAPSITCPATVTVPANMGSCFATGVSLGAPTTNDNCGVAGTSNNGLASYPVGTTIVTWTVTDIHGNTNTCTQSVIVNDTQAPSITCAANQTQTADPGVCEAIVTVVAPATSDNCTVASVVNDYNSTSDASDTYPVGTTTITWTVTDLAGNTSTCTQLITVTDNEGPVITCAPNVVINSSCPPATTTLTPPTATDNCTGIASITNNAPLFYPLGVTTVTWIATDLYGNTSTCNQTVTVTTPEADITGNGWAIMHTNNLVSLINHTDFGNQNVCAGTVTRTYTLRNSGTGNLTLTGAPNTVILTGLNANQFSVISQPAPGTIVAPGASVTFQVRFDPTSAGFKNARITVYNTDCNEGGYYFAIRGKGIACPAIDPIDDEFVAVDDLEVISQDGTSQTTNIETETEWNGKLYPNPSDGIFTLELSDVPSGDVEMRMVDALGQVIYAAPIMLQSSYYDFSYLRAGTYYVQVITKDRSFTKQIIITQRY